MKGAATASISAKAGTVHPANGKLPFAGKKTRERATVILEKTKQAHEQNLLAARIIVSDPKYVGLQREWAIRFLQRVGEVAA